MSGLSPANIQAYTVRIITPALKKENPDDTITEVVPFVETMNARIKLERECDNLLVSLALEDESDCNKCGGPLIPEFAIMRITPIHRPTSAMSFGLSNDTYECTINSLDVLHNGQYGFDITLQTTQDLPGNKIESGSSFSLAMGSMLTDVHSVDICLLFDTHLNYPSVGIWAHRAILSRYEKFNELIKQAGLSQILPVLSIKHGADGSTSDSTVTAYRADNPNRPVIRIRGYSLTTISVLLRYIYTGEIDLCVNLSNHVISSFKTTIVVHDENGMKQETPFDPVSTWKFRDVSWEELLEAAINFGITSLQTECEEAIIREIRQSTVINTLFNIGMLSSEIREAALEFIVNNSKDLSCDGNPFDEYKNHPDCVYYMYEVMQRCSKYDGNP